MSTPAAAAAVDVTDATPVKKGKKKLIVIGVAVLLLLAAAGGGAAFALKKRAAAAAAAEDGEGGAETAAAEQVEKVDPKVVPAFVALDMFTVNLADREAERYAQIGITLELTDAKVVDQIKNYMPAIRNNILMVLADKTSAQLLAREGKETLAAEIQREAVRPLGYRIEAPAAAASGAAAKKKPAADDDNPPPVKRVHFSNFIIQ